MMYCQSGDLGTGRLFVLPPPPPFDIHTLIVVFLVWQSSPTHLLQYLAILSDVLRALYVDDELCR